MKFPVLKSTLAALILAGSAPAFADLIYVPSNQVSGTGLGAVNTVLTEVDTNRPGGTDNGIESGCIAYDPSTGTKTTTKCAGILGVEGGDNQAINNLYSLSQISGLTSAGDLAVVVNISEGGQGGTALLTNLYLSLYNTSTGMIEYFDYKGVDLALSDTGGIGKSGNHLFVLNAAQADAANLLCGATLSNCLIGGGLQFGYNSTDNAPETMYVTYYKPPTQVPEPFSLALVGAGMLGMGFVRSRRSRR
jgi:hypothetical protein